jgi:hypothetical protein
VAQASACVFQCVGDKTPRPKCLSENCETRAPAAEQAAEKAGRFVGRGFSHDVSALDSSGVLTPEGRQCHFFAACEAALMMQVFISWLKPRPTKVFTFSHRL